jgi:hypothetical protein
MQIIKRFFNKKQNTTERESNVTQPQDTNMLSKADKAIVSPRCKRLSLALPETKLSSVDVSYVKASKNLKDVFKEMEDVRRHSKDSNGSSSSHVYRASLEKANRILSRFADA